MATSRNEQVRWLRFASFMVYLKRDSVSRLVFGFSLIAICHGVSQDVTTVDGGKPASQIIGDTGAPYDNLFRSLRVGGSPLQPKVGAGQGFVAVPVLSAPSVHLPLIHRGFRPEDAELKIGRFYLDIRQASASFLFSDNVNATETGRKNGYIGIARLDAAMLFQINDGLQIALAGSVVYLPFQNKIGIAGFGIADPLDVLFGFGPIAQAQIAYDFILGGWDMRVYDDFRVTTAQYESKLQLDQQFEGAQFKDKDVAGRYIYSDGTRNTLGDNRFRKGTLSVQNLEYHNVAGISGSRMVPTVSRATFGYTHENIWYGGNNQNQISSRDTGRAGIVSERENLRFKPFINYETSTDNARHGWDHTLRSGVFGPVTENMDFLGDAGYYWSDESVGSGMIWTLALHHTLGPRTYHSLEYGRTITEPARDLVQYLEYRLSQILAPDITGQIFGEWLRYENERTARSGGTEWRGGAQLNYNISPKSNLRATGTYTKSTPDSALSTAYERYTGRIEFSRKHSETFQSVLIYQYEQLDSSAPGGSYFENLMVLSLRKTF